MKNRIKFILVGLIVLISGCQNKPEILTIGDYQRAESLLSANTDPLVYGIVTGQTWKINELIYKTTVKGGAQFILVDIASGKKETAFDHDRVADILNTLTSGNRNRENYTALDLPMQSVEMIGSTIRFKIGRQHFEVDLNSNNGKKINSPLKDNESLSPNGKKAAFIREYNLWIRDTDSNSETQLTFDGQKDFGYATNNAGWIKKDSPVLLWSPNSDKIATFQHDGRGVKEMYLWSTKVGHPNLEKWKYPLPGDSMIFRIERVIIHLEPQVKLVRLKMDQDAHRSSISDHIADRDGSFLDVEWSKDGNQLAFLSSSRDHKVALLQVANPNTGIVRSVHREKVDTYFESGNRKVNWHILKDSNEVIWFSEKDNWGHLYLYDLVTGDLKNQVTSGEWSVLQVHLIDEENRKIYFMGSNKENGDPYFQYLYRINMDGSDLINLTPEHANHNINWSPSKSYYTDSYSTPTKPPVTVIRDKDGTVVVELEKGDISDLEVAGWIPPVPFIVKARDETTDLYGLMYKPTNFDPSKSYPVLNYLYPGPQSGSIGSRSFRPSRYDKQSLAELGFIVVEVDAMGSPGRSKSFHDAYYGNMGDNGLPDQIGMIKQLAARNSWMDLERVGIWGHSGGGFASTDGILRYPEFYKVAVSGAGNHDNRNYEDDWGEKWQGLLVAEKSKGTALDQEIQETNGTNYDNQANQLLATNLKGKLLIAHGMMDDNVHPSNTMLVVDALIKADKDFDMLVFPNARHGFGNSRYFLKRRWDYFVTHLKGIQPPEGFIFKDNIH